MEHLKKINMSDREIMDGKNGIMCRQSYGFRDPVVKNVVDKFVKRSDVGYEKYNNTLDDERRFKMKNLQGYLNDMTGDQRYYTKVLLKKVANIYRMQLVGIDEMDGW